MLAWIEMYWGSIVILGVIAIIVALIVGSQIRAKKRGFNICGYKCSHCAGGCSGCSGGCGGK